MASRLRLTKHVIVCIFSEPHCPGIGLRNFIMPLRASSFTYDELKSIVIVGSLQYIDQDWSTISNFPKVFILPGSPLCRADLKAVSIGSCDMTVIISSNRTNVLEKTLEDKECILATLNIKAMVFEETMDSSSLLSALFSGNEAKSVNTPPSIENKHYYRIPIITALGGGTPELEEQLADEDALRGSIHAQGKERQRDRCKLARISLCDERFTEFAERGTYGDLFCKALNIYGILCFGIFRLQDPEKQSKKRFVITNPSPLFELNSTDFIMCSVPFPDTQTMATAPYCQKNFSSKFTPLHSLTRRSSIRFTKVHQNLADSSNELKLKDEQRLSDAKYVSTIKVAEEGLRASSKSKLKSVEQTTIEQVKEILKTGDWMKSSKDKKKSIDFTVTEYSKEAPKYDDEIVARQSKKQLKSGEEIIPEVLKKELQVIVGESKDEAKSGEEITVEESNEEAESGEEITAGKSKNEAKSGEEITAGKSKNEAKSGEEITAGKSKDEAKSGEEITAGKSKDEEKV
ncbi:hypothetical protein scyTo_0013640 [Scyliorhinus torazame]|uniref:Uncharacterized protein n=1 Tax=Scyliorhinus torazame TaxID=75743 RepID=A0A401P1H0_SCYTO|nr:hypothetical protein [Scyliorhinus torazame]